MLKKFISAVIAISLVMGMCSCSDSSTTETKKNPTASQSASGEPFKPGEDVVSPTAAYQFVPAADISSDEKFLIGANEFSVDLFRNTVMKDLENGKNTLVSPESVAFALGMTQNGANGATLKQMQNVLYKGVSQDEFNKNMNYLLSEVEKRSRREDDEKLKIANCVWVKDRQDIVPTEQFTKTCKEMYNAELFKGAFDDKTVSQINGWVYDKTDRMIPSVIDKIEPDDVMYLVNCVAFDAQWQKQYKDSQVEKNQKFTNAKGDEVKCTMLTGTEKCYLSNERAIGFTKDYAGGRYEFMAVLPNEDISVSDFVSTMTADEFSKLYKSRSYDYEVTTKLPQFTFDHELRLKDALQSMGMTEAFSQQNADFTKMFEDTPAYIAQVFHKTHIELDAKGTKAAAATAVEAGAKADFSEPEYKEVILDRPFVFAIMDTASGLPVFIGTVCDPSVQ